MEKRRQFNQGRNNWIQVDNHSTDTIGELKEKYGLTDEMLLYALDKNEQARVEYDLEEKTLLVVFNVPYQQKVYNHYVANPATFILKEENLFTFTTKETAYIVPMIENLLHQRPNQSQYSLLFHSLLLIADCYFPLIEEITSERVILNEKLRSHTTNKHLLALSDLSVGLVYLVTATKQNAVLLQSLKTIDIYRRMTTDEQEQLDDALIEAQQADEMTQVSAQILQQLSSTYNNLLNNNLNDTMKVLTIWSLLLTIPTIVTGFFGMNMDLPFTKSAFSWGIAIIISVALSLWLLVIIWRRIK